MAYDEILCGLCQATIEDRYGSYTYDGLNFGSVRAIAWMTEWPCRREWLSGAKDTPRYNTCEQAFDLRDAGFPIHSVLVGSGWYHGLASRKLVDKIVSLPEGQSMRLHTGHRARWWRLIAPNAWGGVVHPHIEVEEVA